MIKKLEIVDPIPERTVNRIIEIIRKFSEQDAIEGVGISIPGLVTPATGNVIFVPYFKWRDLPIGEMISQSRGLPVTIDNDANAVALARVVVRTTRNQGRTRFHLRAGC